ncbi:MAG: Lpg1974 family pore-forming outer membrane protein [Rhodospirillales bacterium]
MKRFAHLSWVSLVCAAAALSVPTLSHAADASAGAPSNEELFRLLQGMQTKLESLESENGRLRQELETVRQAVPAPDPKAGPRYNDYSDLLAPNKTKSGYSASVGSTAYFTFGDAFAVTRPGSTGNGINGTDSETSSVDKEAAPSIDAELAYKFENSQWTLAATGSYLRSVQSSDVYNSGGDQLVPAFSLSTPTIPQTIEGSSELIRGRIGFDGRYAFIDTRDSGFGVEMGLAGAVLTHDMDIATRNSGLFSNEMAFYGVGPRVGVNARHGFGGGFGIKGGLGGSLYTGYGLIKQEQPAANERISEADLRVVPMVDLRLASTLDWSWGDWLFGAELGLKAEHWANLPDWYYGTHTAQVNPAKSGADNMTFMGPYLEFRANF